MPWYTDPILLVLLFTMALSSVAILCACVRSSQISRHMDRLGPASFQVMGADQRLHTITRHPGTDPLPDPDPRPG